jgi:hypothetical protein
LDRSDAIPVRETLGGSLSAFDLEIASARKPFKDYGIISDFPLEIKDSGSGKSGWG